MGKLLFIVVLLLAAVLAAILGRCQPPAEQAVPSSPSQTGQTGASPQPVDVTPADAEQLIVQAVGTDATQAIPAFRKLEQAGSCPYLPASPESPVGLAAAAYGSAGVEPGNVRETIRLLVRLGCDINQYSAIGLTPLHGAIVGRQPGLLRVLLEEGADPRLRVVQVPGQALGRSLAHLDAWGVAQVIRQKFPDDAALGEIVELLKAAA